jgi:hypothetical protein
MELIYQKKCTKCNKIKDLLFFGKNRSHKDGLQVWCKKCKNNLQILPAFGSNGNRSKGNKF